MKTNAAGLALIKGFEGCRLDAYQDCVGVWTIGYGHTGTVAAEGVRINPSSAEVLLETDLRWAEVGVAGNVTVPLNANQFSALVSFVFNLGLHAFEESTLLRKLNAGDYEGAAAEFPKWDRAGGRQVLGLHRRRVAEQALFLVAPQEQS